MRSISKPIRIEHAFEWQVQTLFERHTPHTNAAEEQEMMYIPQVAIDYRVRSSVL